MEQAEKSKISLRFLVIFTIVAIAVLIIWGTPILKSSGTSGFPIQVSLLAALFGGFLALFYPCSAALLPAFFAYSFKAKTKLLEMTLVFFLGLATIFIPLGFSASLIGKLFVQYRGTLFLIAGVLFFIFGLMVLFSKTFSLLPSFLRIKTSGRSYGSVYLMGISYGFAAGTCTAPIIGAIITLASTYANTAQSVLLLITYSLGMVLPLFILAYFFDRYKVQERKLLRGKLWTFKIGGSDYHLHSTNLIAALLFFLLGFIFIFSKGTNAFFGILTKLGATDIYFRISDRLLVWTERIPNWIFIILVLAIITFFYLKRRKKLANDLKNQQ